MRIKYCLALPLHRKNQDTFLLPHVGTLQVGPRYANMLGGKKVTIIGPCYNETHVLQCNFGNIVVDGRVVDRQTAECVAPYMGATGTVPLTVSINGGKDFIFHGKFVYGKWKYNSPTYFSLVLTNKNIGRNCFG